MRTPAVQQHQKQGAVSEWVRLLCMREGVVTTTQVVQACVNQSMGAGGVGSRWWRFAMMLYLSLLYKRPVRSPLGFYLNATLD
ncbi:hypothetical protein HBI56_073510 [Parastagonospora nodorum]|uniref:Uncharacterized protein n=1 Tax=Phaeosphaeria nodorum (strain SN15 / ATCC MYA-4574 / FGSC 10173) TaxID=321614 RepID=A0A7U2EWQ6_PHANO|nr:hypothetical protein HBH56_171450 [Parastagonospora nodorum]QRC94526.1 hypothetical protein JI435_405990 [Parastagonospora nodorum SN15]KAH3928421.1 hypothetical protein HBH54_140010 [Parastagonospora nodorum]KAH3945319.1 hypothetical protein HBH53_145360 [Parastagonospora nodorum]KAH3984020.1 hypothetical protein HBH52_058860 [Parastagonospora nodorum]